MSVSRKEDAEQHRRKSRREYSGKVISLDVDTVQFPDGSSGELEIVRHPGASAVIAFLDDAHIENPRVLLIKQYRYAAGAFLLEIPAGKLEAGESPMECAARELKEETGWSARSFEHLLTMYTTPGFTDERIHLFVAFGLEPGEPAREKDEVLDIEIVPISAAIEMISSGEIEDAKTAIAILFSDHIRRKR